MTNLDRLELELTKLDHQLAETGAALVTAQSSDAEREVARLLHRHGINRHLRALLRLWGENFWETRLGAPLEQHRPSW